MTTYHFAVSGMHCASCGMLIDETLEDIQGVRRAETSVRAGRTTVEADADLTVEAVAASIAQLGYQARLENAS